MSHQGINYAPVPYYFSLRMVLVQLLAAATSGVPSISTYIVFAVAVSLKLIVAVLSSSAFYVCTMLLFNNACVAAA
jgi:hypothetical protein